MVQLVEALPATGRKLRNPKHPFMLNTRPFEISPFFIAPVIPGETMKNLLLQSRVVSDPLKSSIVGWWKEYYFFYVKHRDLDIRDDLTALMLDPSKTLATHNAVADRWHHHAAGTINWSYHCLKKVVEEFFRDEGQAWDSVVRDGRPLVNSCPKGDNWMDSLTPDASMVDIDPNDTSAEQLDPQYIQWEFMRAQKLINMTYEDWLATFGVRKPRENNKPELVRYIRDWTYPANTADATGNVNTVASWSIAERADKDRAFREPGFLFGVTVTRPKMYFSTSGSLVDFMNDAFSWLPAVLRDEPYTSLKKFAKQTGPINSANQTDDYWVDMRDLLLYGDQFINIDTPVPFAHVHTRPLSTIGPATPRGIEPTDIDALFKVAANNKIREDGVVSLSILGAQVDMT